VSDTIPTSLPLWRSVLRVNWVIRENR
jgi:hypothetical protein